MAEINSHSRSAPGKVRSKKFSTRIDMTPMVDLGFLLLTFFILTAVLSKPFVMRVDMPEETTTDPPPINARKVLTLVLKEDNSIYWFAGEQPHIQRTGFSTSGIRKLLANKRAEIPGLYVLIKAADQSHYKNLVDILDEMAIAEIIRYAVVDVTAEDEQRIREFRADQGL